MDELASINSKLEKAARLLDEAAAGLSNSAIPCRTADIQSIAKALSSIFDIRSSIYEIRPDLKPEYLQTEQEHPDANREFGRILIQRDYLLAKNQPEAAISLFENFICSRPPHVFSEMADDEINKIRKLFSV